MDVPSDLLLRWNLVEPAQLQEALELQRNQGGALLDILVEKGALTRKQASEILAYQLGVPYVELTSDAVSAEVIHLIPPRRCREMEVLPLRIDPTGTLLLAMADPTDLMKLDDAQFMTGMRVQPVLVDRSSLLASLADLFPEAEEIESRIQELGTLSLEGEQAQPEVGPIDLSEVEPHEAPPVIALLNLILRQAILARASDIHVEPKEKMSRVRFRVDGVLADKDPIPIRYRSAVTARVKVLSHLDITERRVPQDGAFSVLVDGRKVDFRVSTFPTLWGEKVVMRILDKSSLRVTFEQLGFPARVEGGIREFMGMHDGIFLVTGPTGSGKSTTLYTLLGAMDTAERNIVTLEDPVEYQIESITQGQANPKQGFTFASGLRSILRQDPDIVLVGEVRDLETARIAVQASLTGHLVLSTLHTNTSYEAVIRLQDMGLEPFLIAAALRGTLAQRLARRLCQVCREPYQPTEELLRSYGIEAPPGTWFCRPVGCKACGGTGYRGRMGLYELFRMTDEAQRLIARRAETKELLQAAYDDGYRTLRQHGFEKVVEGVTSLEEVLRVT